MSATFGTVEIALRLSQSREERVSLALIQAAISALPDDAGELRTLLFAWTQTPGPLAQDSLENAERLLLQSTHAERGELGLLSQVAPRAAGQVVAPDSLPEDWMVVHAPFVLALALRRIRLLAQALGSKVALVDVDNGALS